MDLKLPFNLMITALVIALVNFSQTLNNNFNNAVLVEASGQILSNNFRVPALNQLTLPPTNQNAPSISLVEGFNQKKSEEEEDGFIMQSASSVAATTTTITAEESTTPTNTDAPTTATTIEQTEQSIEQNDQRIPIDVNRQQFITHDQLLNASTKDENINFNNGDAKVQRIQSSRAGMSKASHVSSFLSDLFAYATSHQEEPSTTKKPQPQQQQKTPATCPGICRSILTASILCRNEINAPCPSFLQKCCDNYDVSFNGTPVETSAPLPSTDIDNNSALLPDNLSQAQEQTAFDNQATLPSAPQTTALPSNNSLQRQQSKENGSQITNGAAAATTTTTQATTQADFTTTSGINLLLAANQPASIYFLSSGSGTQDVAQPSHDDQGARFKNPASQSFDLPLNVDSMSSTPLATTNGEHLTTTTTSKPPQAVVVQTANGTILHQPIRRPIYANWTDYHLSLIQNRPTTSQSVIYHSNIDPVKSFIATATPPKNDLNLTTSIRRTLVLPETSSDEVLNDQHSSGSTKSRTTPAPQVTTKAAATTTTTTAATTTTTTTRSTIAATSPPYQDSSEQNHQPVESVGNVLVSLLDSWIGGTSSSQSATSQSDKSPDEMSPTPAGPLEETPVTENSSPMSSSGEQQNDRRLGYDLSFRQNTGNQANSMNSDGNDEQVQSSNQPSKCSGYCTIPLFTMLCDSTYRSADCGTSQKCCVVGKQTGERNYTNHDDQIVSNSGQLAADTCQGSCLPVYHSSLCTKPNELQVDSPGCLPNYVCCNQPEGSTSAGNQIGEELDGLINAADSSQSHVIGDRQPMGVEQIKDSTFLAALLPPPPPPIQIPQTDQIIQEKTFMNQPTTNRPNIVKTTQSPGFMSQIYQMFKSSATSKQRQRPQMQTQSQPQLQYQQPSINNNLMYNQMYDPYHQPFQVAATALRPTSAAPPIMHVNSQVVNPQQVMYQQQLVRFPQQPQQQTKIQYQQHQPLQQSHTFPINLNPFNENTQMLLSTANSEQNPTLMNFNVPVNFNHLPQQQPHLQQQSQLSQNSVRQLSNPVQRQSAQQNGVSFSSNNGPERQWHQINKDNTHNAPLNQQRQFPLHSNPTLAFGLGDANGSQQQQQAVTRPPVQQPDRLQHQQSQPLYTGPVRSGQPESINPNQIVSWPSSTTPTRQRQNPVSRPLLHITSTSTMSPDMRQAPNEPNQHIIRAQQLQQQQQEQQQQQLQQQKQQQQQQQQQLQQQQKQQRPQPQQTQILDELGLRRNNATNGSNNWLATKVSNKSTKPIEVSSTTTLTQPLPGLSPAPSNLNVLINSGPFIDLQRVDNRRQQPLTTTRPTDDLIGSSASPMEDQQQSTANTIDGNKLDLDDQIDSEELAPSSGGSDLQPDSSAIEEQSSPALASKNRLQASSCGLPGPKRRRLTSGRARGRVMGGFDAKPDYWCWQAALMNNKNEYLCGGALIGAKWILTAAHCVTQHLRSESQLYVRLGQHNLNATQVEGSKHPRTIQVKTSYVHHNHNGITLDNDIALLRLEKSVDLEEPSVCLVCLPERSSQIEPGKRCTVTGYGFESEAGPAALRVRQTELPIVGDQECQNKTSAVLGKPFALPASSFCAGGEVGQDACHGDGGSPLSCLVDGYYELTGIVSWGYKCGSKDLPGLYSKVSSFVGWINQIVSVNN